MNIEETTQIRTLRDEGLSYTEIAKRLAISINTIKSYCKRNNLGGVSASKTPVAVCALCTKPIKQTKGRKAKRFCSDTCRNTWWNKHSNLVNRKASYHCVCFNCGKTFLSYGNSTRKYCSHACYIEKRFGGKHHADR